MLDAGGILAEPFRSIREDTPMPDSPLGQQPSLEPNSEKKSELSRRGFLQTAAAGLAGLAGAAALPQPAAAEVPALEIETGGPLLDPPAVNFIQDRQYRARQMRLDCAELHYNEAFPEQHHNGDEARYPANHVGSYSKGLPKMPDGTCDPAAYEVFRAAVVSGSYQEMEGIITGPGSTLRQKSPLGALSYRLEGCDSAQIAAPPAPEFSSAWEAADAVELYWRAITRDVAYTKFSTDPLIALAVEDMNRLSDYRGPRENGVITPNVIFRGYQAGAQRGPFLSQFLLLPYYFGNARIHQVFETPVADEDFLTSWEEWMAIQNGQPPTRRLTFDPVHRYIRNGRDLGEWLHRDFSYQGPLVAAMILMGYGETAWDPGNPTVHSTKQCGFTTLGGPDVLDLVAKASKPGLGATWYQKWQVHRRLRPEEYAGRVHAHKTGLANFPIHSDMLNSNALMLVWNKYLSWLLPQAFPEGCPPHPAYPGGHSTFAAAGCTMLKAFFKEDFIIPNPVVPNDDGTALVPWQGEALTVGGELDKLASNIAHGRDGAGVHWRTDCQEGMKIGEKISIEILRDLMTCYAEPVRFSLTKFDGTRIELG
jgi:hypothetical protein